MTAVEKLREIMADPEGCGDVDALIREIEGASAPEGITTDSVVRLYGLRGEWRTVNAKLFGSLAVNEDRAGWAVTHVPTGLSIRRFELAADAVKCAEQCNVGADAAGLSWDFPDTAAADMKAMYKIVREATNFVCATAPGDLDDAVPPEFDALQSEFYGCVVGLDDSCLVVAEINEHGIVRGFDTYSFVHCDNVKNSGDHYRQHISWSHSIDVDGLEFESGMQLGCEFAVPLNISTLDAELWAETKDGSGLFYCDECSEHVDTSGFHYGPSPVVCGDDTILCRECAEADDGFCAECDSLGCTNSEHDDDDSDDSDDSPDVGYDGERGRTVPDSARASFIPDNEQRSEVVPRECEREHDMTHAERMASLDARINTVLAAGIPAWMSDSMAARP